MANVIIEQSVRPWGSYTVVDEGDGFKVKRIVVKPGQRLSYQRHMHRAEHWLVVSGEATVTLDDVLTKLRPGESIDVGVGVAHRVLNSGSGDLVFVEVQRGAYLGEDDIVRLDDDYGRAAR